MPQPLTIANAGAFWGDRPIAAKELLESAPEIDVLTLDYLAEVSMSILAIQREKDPNAGFAKDFLEVLSSVAPFWKKGRGFCLITNAGGLNPLACGKAAQKLLQEAGIGPLKIAIITGDNLLEELKQAPTSAYSHLDTKEPIGVVQENLTTANAYLGSLSIVEALNQGADLIITGRVADPCLTVAPCMAHFGWTLKEYDKLAAATIAGHLIECGTQVTGGFSTNWLEIEKMDFPGYPLVKMEESGEFILTKPKTSEGCVTLQTVKEQLLYEIGDPDNYLSPDVTVSFLSLKLEEIEKNSIKVTGAKGKKPPEKLKVSATYRDGYKTEGTLALFGPDCQKKGERLGKIIEKRLQKMGKKPEEYLVECIGTGSIVPGLKTYPTQEIMLRFAAKDHSKEPLIALSKEIAPLVTSGPQGVTGYTSGRPKIRPVYSFWPTLVSCDKINQKLHFLEVTS